MKKYMGFLIIFICVVELYSQNPILLDNYYEGKCYSTYLEDNYAYFSAGKYLKIVDYSDTLNIDVIGEYKLDDDVRDIIVRDNFVFIANNNFGIAVLNVSDKANPYLVYQIDSLQNIINIFEDDNYLFAIEHEKSIHIFERNNSILSYVNNIDIACLDLEKRNDLLFVVDTTYSLNIFDIANISEPSNIATYNYDVTDIELKENLVFMASLDDSIFIYDMISPTEPKRINELAIKYLDVLNLEISDNKMYVGLSDHYTNNWDAGVQVFDISDVNNIEYMQWLYIYTEYNALDNCDLSVSGEQVGFVSQWWGFYLFKTSEEEFQSEYYKYALTFKAGNSDMLGNHIFVADKRNGMRILEISDSSILKQVSYLPIKLEEGPVSPDIVEELKVYDNIAYVLSHVQGLKIVDVNDVTKPIIINTHSLQSTYTFYLDIIKENNYAYIFTTIGYGWGGELHAIDISNPLNIVDKGSFEFDVEGNYFRHKIEYFQDHIYFSRNTNNISIINVGNPDSLKQVNLFETPNSPGSISINKDKLYLAAKGNGSSTRGIYVYDISTPANPSNIAFYHSDHNNYKLDIEDNYLYSSMKNSLFVLDISDVSKINQIGEYSFDYDIESITSSGNQIFVSTRYSGVYSLKNSLITRIAEDKKTIPKTTILEQNYPNPFNPITNIRFTIPQTSKVTINIYNNLGQRVLKLADSFVAGEYNVKFDGAHLASGVYYYQIITPSFSQTKKMLLIK